MIYNIQTNIIAAGVVLLILLNSRYSQVYLPENKFFRKMLIHLLILLAMDSVMWAADCQSFIGARTFNLLANHAYYFEQTILAYQWAVYSHSLSRIHLSPTRCRLHRIPLMLGLLLVITNPITQVVFRISADNVYARGWGLWGSIYAVCTFIYLLEAMTIALFRLLRSSRSERQDGWYLLISTALPVFATVIQMLFYGISVIWSFGALGLLILYLNVQARHAVKAEQDLEKSRTAIMLSQIQPHFLYNTLSGIRELCETQPQKAAKAVEHFSHYLRSNMDSLLDERLIPFGKEMAHVKNYLYLEKMRFEERLNIEWDIVCTDFLLPPLTLQPIVENAAKHGIIMKDEGGTITIKTERTAQAVMITVSDDGAGIDESKTIDDGRSHVGLDNVRKRLASQLGGELHIESEKDNGTTVKIILPAKGVGQ